MFRDELETCKMSTELLLTNSSGYTGNPIMKCYLSHHVLRHSYSYTCDL